LKLSNRSYPSSFGFKSKPKEIEEKDGEGIQEDICDLSTEGQNQTISTFETITDVTDKEEDRLELESFCEETRESGSKGNVYESFLVSPFSNDAVQRAEITEEL